MSYRVDLAFRVDEALAELPEDGRQEAMETIAKVLVRRDAWPSFGGWEGVLWFGAEWTEPPASYAHVHRAHGVAHGSCPVSLDLAETGPLTCAVTG